ncbi:condensation domain-containing protein, partial [Streptomyces sp. URMC 123]|uniref:condensation domain-containing protein n=1 Tax=Streptomyces sp. URMC 123 TaxID=3423403 RepID=UPI003F1CCEA9
MGEYPAMHDHASAATAVGLPLLPAQAGIWYAQALDPTSPAYNTGDSVEIHGRLDEDRFEEALRRAVAEAETLNAVVTVVDGRPLQRVETDRPWPLHRFDLRDTSGSDAGPRTRAEAWMRAELARPVDPTRDRLVTQALFRVADDIHLWYQGVHHLAVDAYALTLVHRRVAEIYAALVAGRPVPPRTFGTLDELVADEAAYRAGERHATDGEFWRGHLAGLPEPAGLAAHPAARTAPAADPVEPTDPFSAADPVEPAHPAPTVLRRTVDLPEGSMATLERAAAAAKATWAELVVAATAGYTHRLTGARDVVLGLPTLNRRGPAALRTPVATAQVLPLRLAVGPDDTGAELLRRVVLALRAARRHQRYPMEELRRDLGRTADRRPLFGPVVNIKPFEGELDFGGLRATVRNLAAGPVDDLAVTATPGPDGALRLAFDANPEHYTDACLARHEEGLIRYLDGLTALLLENPAEPVGTLDLLTLRQVHAATAGRDEPTVTRTLPELFAEQAARTPDAVALRCGARALTYAETSAAVGRLAHELAALGVGPERPVALALPRGTDTVVAILAVLAAGGVCVTLDLGHPAQRLAAVLDDARPVCVVTTREALAALPPDVLSRQALTPHATAAHGLPAVVLDDPATRARIAARPHHAPAPPPAP